MPFERKYDKELSTAIKVRVTPEQKTLLSLVSASADADSMSDFWRAYSVYSAELLLKYQAGEITAEEYGDLIADYIIEHGGSATVEQDDTP